MLPARRSGQNVTIVDPSREFEDIYGRMGQLMNLAMGDFGLATPADVPWSPLGDVSETDDAYRIQVELPGVAKDQVDVQVQDRELVISGEIKESRHGLLRRRPRSLAGSRSAADQADATSRMPRRAAQFVSAPGSGQS
jgi:HSP20 family protein